MKHRYWVMAVWLVATLGLLALGVHFALDISRSARQGTLEHWEQEVIRFVTLGMVIGLSSLGAYCELRRSPRS